MKCELCREREAEVAVKQTVDGKVRERFVCKACAQRTAGSLVGSLVELLLGAALDEQPPRDERVCPGCGLLRSEFRRRERVGCARCYDTFARDLAPMLRDMHGGDHHVGELPVRERLRRKRSELDAALQEAVRSQRFEDAAVLRDRLRSLDAEETPPAPGGSHAVA